MKLNEVAQKDPLIPAKSISTSGIKKIVKLALQSFERAAKMKGEDYTSCKSRVEFVMGGIELLTNLHHALLTDHAVANLKMEGEDKKPVVPTVWKKATFYGGDRIQAVLDSLKQHWMNLTIDTPEYSKPGFRAHILEQILVTLKAMLNKLETQLAIAKAAVK